MACDFPDSRQTPLAEVDRALVHALQIDPRAPWARIAQVLRVDAATAARRWAAIADAGIAWFTVRATAERDVGCGDVALVVLAGPVSPEEEVTWCALPWVLSVERTSVGLVLLVERHGGLWAVDSRLRETFARPGREMRVEYAADVPRADSQWRLPVLEEQWARSLEPAPVVAERMRPPREEVVDEVTALLREDARMPLGALASRLGVSDATARRTVERLLGQGLVRVGCDVAMPRVGLGRGVVLRVEGWDAPAAADEVLAHPSVHRLLTTVGPVRATVSLRLGALSELPALEKKWSGIRVVDRWTVTAVLKRNGHLLGPDGRSTGPADTAA